ncbi:hypothetical protein ACSTHM_23450, partial [Vibrio parahaemolyticus]
IKSATEALAQVSMKLGEALYKAQQGEAGAAPGGDAGAQGAAGAKADDGIVDADFEEVKDDKKKSA